jgi:hypothetical protein
VVVIWERTPPGVLVKARRCFASVTRRRAETDFPFLAQRKDERMSREVRDREDALASRAARSNRSAILLNFCIHSV